MLINDLSETSPRRRRIIQTPVRTEPPIALIGADGRSAELETALKRSHPLITFPSISHFLAEPPRREAWAAIVMARSSAWDVRLSGYVSGRRCIALFAQPEEGYGWPDDVTRIRELGEVDAWLARLKEPEPIRVLKRTVQRTPRKPKAAPSDTPSWLKQDARVWNALGSPSSSAASEPATQPEAAAPRKPASRRPPEQLSLGGLGGSLEKKTQRPPQPSRPPKARAAGSGTRGQARASRRDKQSRATPELPALVARPELAPQRIAELTRVLLRQSKPLSLRDEVTFLEAAAEVGIVRALELLEALERAARALTARL